MKSMIKKKNTKNKLIDVENDSVSSVHVFSYRLLKNHVQFLYPRLTGLEKNLKQAMMPIPFDVYVCSMVFLSMIATIIGAVVGASIFIIMNIQPPSLGVLITLVSAVGIGQITFFVLQVIPSINIKNRSAKLTEELPNFI